MGRHTVASFLKEKCPTSLLAAHVITSNKPWYNSGGVGKGRKDHFWKSSEPAGDSETSLETKMLDQRDRTLGLDKQESNVFGSFIRKRDLIQYPVTDPVGRISPRKLK